MIAAAVNVTKFQKIYEKKANRAGFKSFQSQKNSKSNTTRYYRKRALSIQEQGPDGFTNFPKKIHSPGDHRAKYFIAQ